MYRILKTLYTLYLPDLFECGKLVVDSQILPINLVRSIVSYYRTSLFYYLDSNYLKDDCELLNLYYFQFILFLSLSVIIWHPHRLGWFFECILNDNSNPRCL